MLIECADRPPGFFQAIMQQKAIRSQDILPHGNFPNAGLDLAHAWLRKCLDEHPTCRHVSPRPEYVPTRLIDVCYESDSGMEKQWRLCEMQDSDAVEPYLTLSHCWGSMPALCLTTTNIEEFKAGVSDSCLPPKYLDAIFVTRRLGFRYIWIDSLCIVQDSKEGWLRESMVMHDVYRNSACTLAASMAGNASERFLRQRDPLITLAEVVQLNWIEESKGFWWWSRSTDGGKYIINHQNFFRMCLSRSSLAQRAWCLQELLLSLRVLHFEEDQLFWECRTLKSCEANPFITMPCAMDEASPVTSDLFRGLPLDEIPRMYSRRPANCNVIVEAYTEGSLTKPEDKLVAIAGVAKAYQGRFGGHYLAGLWSNELPYSLVWYVKGSKTSRIKPFQYVARVKPYRAPSWSWCSVDGLYPVRPCADKSRHKFLDAFG